MVDPDAPGPAAPILADFLHWIVSDVQPKGITTQQRKQVAMYMFPTPLPNSSHRYTFLVYRQPPNYVPPPSLNYLPGVRAKFDLAAYVKEAKPVGPVGGITTVRARSRMFVCCWLGVRRMALGMLSRG